MDNTLNHLKAFVNNPVQWSAFLDYLKSEVELQNRKLQQSTEMVDVYRAQGAVQMLDRVAKLKERVDVHR